MTGSELRQYLHISTRKLKYLMDHNYIPHEDTGQSTYKYRVLVKDARTFKRRMKCEPGFLSELSGLFTSTRPARSPAPNRARERIDSAEFEKYLLLRWADLPDALPTLQAARLISVSKSFPSIGRPNTAEKETVSPFERFRTVSLSRTRNLRCSIPSAKRRNAEKKENRTLRSATSTASTALQEWSISKKGKETAPLSAMWSIMCQSFREKKTPKSTTQSAEKRRRATANP